MRLIERPGFSLFVVERQRRDEERRRQVNERRLQHEETRKKWESGNPGKTWALTPFSLSGALAMAAPAPAAGAAESITNNQSAGVDEGGFSRWTWIAINSSQWRPYRAASGMVALPVRGAGQRGYAQL